MNKQNASPKKTIEMDFVDFYRQPTKLITQWSKRKVADREPKVYKIECIKVNHLKSSCQWSINTTVIKVSLYTQGVRVCFAAQISLTSIVTRHPCMQDTPYLTLPFSLLSEVFSVFGFAKYAPIVFGKNVRANKTSDHEVYFLSVAD